MNAAEFLIDLANGNIKDKSIPSELEDKLLTGVKHFEDKDGRPFPGDVHEYLAGVYRLRTSNMKKTGLHKSIVLNGKFERLTLCYARERGETWCEQVCILFKTGFLVPSLLEQSSHYSTYIDCDNCRIALVAFRYFIPEKSSRSGRSIVLYFSILGFLSSIYSRPHIPTRKAMLAKERSVDMYKLSAYLVSRNTSDLPLDLVLPIVLSVVVYFMVNLKMTFTAFLLTSLAVFLSIIAAQGLGLAIGAAFMDVKKAMSLALVTVMAFMLSGGFFIQKVPAFMSWIRYISLNYRTYRLILQFQYSCNEGASGPVICDSPFIKGQRLNRGGTEVGAMFMMIIGYRILTCIFLRRMKLRKVK